MSSPAQTTLVFWSHSVLSECLTTVDPIGPTKVPISMERDADCAICYEPLFNNDSKYHTGAQLTRHQACSNIFHSDCLNIWVDEKEQEGAALTCPMCRGQLKAAPTNINTAAADAVAALLYALRVAESDTPQAQESTQELSDMLNLTTLAWLSSVGRGGEGVDNIARVHASFVEVMSAAESAPDPEGAGDDAWETDSEPPH